MGYNSLTSLALEIAYNEKGVDAGDLFIEEDVVSLQEVTVIGQRNLVEEKPDRTIYNAEFDKTTVGGSVSEAVRRRYLEGCPCFL